MKDTEAFLKESAMARAVGLEARLVVWRGGQSLEQTRRIGESGSFQLAPAGESDSGRVCELEVAGRVIARGRIVRTAGAYKFKVSELVEETL